MGKVKKAWRESVHEIREFIRHEQEVKIAEQAKEDMGNGEANYYGW